MSIALSRNARTLLVHCLSGEEFELTTGAICAIRELQRPGLLKKGATRPTREASRRREFLPHDGPLSKAALARFRRHVAGDRDVTDANRAAYRELAAAGLMVAGNSFAGGDESVYDLTKEGFERKAEILAQAGAREGEPTTSPSPGRAAAHSR